MYPRALASPIVTFGLSLGTLRAEIFVDRRPIARGNVVRLAKEGFYDGLHCHRVIDNFMCQFGCPHSKDPMSPRCGTGDSPHGAIPDEHPPGAQISNEIGTLAMANSGPNSGSSQFFINTKHNAYLDFFSGGASKHPVFGKVTEGMDIVRKIGSTAVDHNDRPRTPVKMIKITIA